MDRHSSVLLSSSGLRADPFGGCRLRRSSHTPGQRQVQHANGCCAQGNVQLQQQRHGRLYDTEGYAFPLYGGQLFAWQSVQRQREEEGVQC
ncbi:unnamed protein product [Nesidiocoris tenuis]|uniref:Uncharacterized protein n=1 Tax=Nesidiocoris tenuis TaxID=355587 RepID=A0A6H5GE32_9HEMI|nr:unnamed protein product [Nesidiocoris tenuis]